MRPNTPGVWLQARAALFVFRSLVDTSTSLRGIGSCGDGRGSRQGARPDFLLPHITRIFTQSHETPDLQPRPPLPRCDRYEGEPEEVMNPKKKVWEKISPDLVTDAGKAVRAAAQGVARLAASPVAR